MGGSTGTDPDTSGTTLGQREVWIEIQGGALRVHCYDPAHDEPISVNISLTDVTVSTDREAGILERTIS